MYLNGTAAGRLLPALRGRPTVLHVHDMARRVPRHWLNADLVLADSRECGVLLDPLEVHVVGSPLEMEPARSGESVERVQPGDYADRLDGLLRDSVGHHRRGSERRARSEQRKERRLAR